MPNPDKLRTTGEPDKAEAPTSSEIRGIRTLVDLKNAGYRPFSMAPIYEHAKVDFDIVARFTSESGEKVRSMLINFPFPLINIKSPWAHILQIINEEVWEAFRLFMMGVIFTNRKEEEYWRVVPALATLQDPFSRMSDVDRVPDRCTLDVLLLSGNKRILGIVPGEAFVEDTKAPVEISKIPATINLQWGNPDPRIVAEAKAVFETGGL